MTDALIPAIRAAVEQGRAGRGTRDGARWVRDRARVLSAIAAGQKPAQLASQLGMTRRNVDILLSEGCDAVLRAPRSTEAAAACLATWQTWCAAGDGEARERVRGMREPERGR